MQSPLHSSKPHNSWNALNRQTHSLRKGNYQDLVACNWKTALLVERQCCPILHENGNFLLVGGDQLSVLPVGAVLTDPVLTGVGSDCEDWGWPHESDRR